MIAFETGPVRPPSEAHSLLLRITRGCHWNQCVFCPVYKCEPFSRRSVAEIKRDIDAMATVAERLQQRMGGAPSTLPHRAAIAETIRGTNADERVDVQCLQLMAFWLAQGLQNVFLQDADALVLPTRQLVEILDHLRATFPSIKRITSYARAKTVSRKSPDDMRALRAAGLTRIHIGMESGSDAVLALMHKGVTQEEQIRAGRQAIAAGIELSEYFMPGLGGQEWSAEHALESAAVLNAVNPTFLRIRTTVPVPGTPLHGMMTAGQWTPLGEVEKVAELRRCLERLDGVTTTVQSDHVMNLLEDVAGRLPNDKPRILEPIDRFLALSRADQEAFIVGRRIGRFRYVSDYTPSPEVEAIRRELIDRFGTLEEGIQAIVARFI